MRYGCCIDLKRQKHLICIENCASEQTGLNECSVGGTTHLDWFAEPCCTLSISIVTLLFDSLFLRIVHTDSVLHVVLPLTNVLISIGEDHSALTFLFSSFEIALIHATVFERELSLTFEQIL